MLLAHTFVTLVSRTVALNEAPSHPGRPNDRRAEGIHLSVTDVLESLPGCTLIERD